MEDRTSRLTTGGFGTEAKEKLLGVKDLIGRVDERGAPHWAGTTVFRTVPPAEKIDLP